MRRKVWLRMCRKKAVTKEIEKQKRIKAFHLFVDGVPMPVSEDMVVEQAETIKITGTLCSDAETLLHYGLKVKEVAVVDLSEAKVDDEDGKWWLSDYDFGRKVIIPADCKECIVSDRFSWHKVEEIVASPEHQHFKSIDGVLYSKDGSLLVAYPRGKRDKKFVVPDEVREIGYLAFSIARNLEELQINDGCLKLHHDAIYRMDGLKRIYLGNTLQTLDYWAIFWCDALEEITLPSSLQEYIYEAIDCKNLRLINVEDGGDTFYSTDGVLYNKKDKAFVRCPRNYQGESVSIQEGVSKILSEAFNYCTNLKHLHLPKSLETIEPDTFTGSENIESVTIEEGNEHFCIDGGILYNADKTVLVYCPPMLDIEELVVPDTVVKIEEEALAYNQNMRRLTIPDSVKEVGHCFLNHTNIEEMWLPKVPPVVTEGLNAFFSNDQFVGYPRRKGWSEYKNLHVPKGSLRLYEADDSIWRYLSGGYVEEQDFV